jgi:hypothetical protein
MIPRDPPCDSRELDRAAYRAVGRAGKAEGARGLERKVERGPERGRKGRMTWNRPRQQSNP